MNAVVGELITAGSTNETLLVLTDVTKNERIDHFVKVISGTVKLGVNDVHANAHGWVSTDVIPPIRCFNGELCFDAASAGDTFVVTVSA